MKWFFLCYWFWLAATVAINLSSILYLLVRVFRRWLLRRSTTLSRMQLNSDDWLLLNCMPVNWDNWEEAEYTEMHAYATTSDVIGCEENEIVDGDIENWIAGKDITNVVLKGNIENQIVEGDTEPQSL